MKGLKILGNIIVDIIIFILVIGILVALHGFIQVKVQKKEKQFCNNNQLKREEALSKQNDKKISRMICYAPWQRLLLDNDGQVRPYAICTKWIGHTKEYSLAQMWNNEAMQMYRRKIANNDFKDLCQPECISGQIRNKLCRPVEDK